MDDVRGLLHPVHMEYLRRYPRYTLATLFKHLDDLAGENRDRLLELTYIIIIRPRLREIGPPNQMPGKIEVDEVSYEAFKHKCYKIVASGLLDHMTLAHLVVSITLHSLVMLADPSTIEQTRANLQHLNDLLREGLEGPDAGSRKPTTFLAFSEEYMRTLPEQVREHYTNYTYFCERVLAELIKEGGSTAT